MKTSAKLTVATLGGIGLAGLALWWFADHRRGVAWAVAVVRGRFPDVSHLSPASLDAWLRDAQRPAPQIVDARSEEEFAVSHLPGARRVDAASTASSALSTLDPGRPIVLYCSAGYRGATLARRLQDAGRRTDASACLRMARAEHIAGMEILIETVEGMDEVKVEIVN